MARPMLYRTEEERKAALRAPWQNYNKLHKAERVAHNKAYCQREDVKQHRKERRLAQKGATPPNNTDET